MVHVLVRHKVSDFTRWKELFDSALNARMHAGELGFHLFQSVNDPRDVTLLLDWDSVEHARQFMGSDDLKTKMQAAGVVGTPEVQYLEDVRAVRRTCGRLGGAAENFPGKPLDKAARISFPIGL